MSANPKPLESYGIRPSDVLTIDGEKWLSAEQLAAILRERGDFAAVRTGYEAFITELNQLIYFAELVDRDGHLYRRSGVATIGERLPTGAETNEHQLASARALRSTLALAGYDLLRNEKVQPLKRGRIELQPDPAHITRRDQIRRLHALATEAGLIEGSNRRGYQEFLLENFDTDSSVDFTERQFEQAINLLRQLSCETQGSQQ